MKQITTDEAAKNAFIMPMLQKLEYVVFNPLEIVREFIADIGVKMESSLDFKNGRLVRKNVTR